MKRIYLFIYFFFVLFSCSNDNEPYNLEVESRRLALANENQEIYISEFNNLSTSDKYLYFSNKLDQVQIELTNNGVDFLDEDIENLRETYLATENNSDYLSDLKVSLKSIASKIPDGDFINMFVSLKNYKYTKFTGLNTGINIDLINDSEFVPYGSHVELDFGNFDYDCNCNWNCDYLASQLPGGSHTSSCNVTSSGCGIFGLSPCYRLLLSFGKPHEL